MSTTHDEHDCAGCPLTGRRDFLRDALAAVAGVAAVLAIPGGAFAMPFGTVAPVAREGSTRAYPIPAADGVQIDDKEEIILARWKGAVYAFALACPHQNTALRWQAAQSRFACPKHKSIYQPDGKYVSGKATRSMDRHGIARAGANVVVDLDTVWMEDENPAEWAGAAVKV
jgi:nitrite reductase/ring-hydroxylating ferredoxin subunit